MVIPGGSSNLISMSRLDLDGHRIIVEFGVMRITSIKTGLCVITAKLRSDGMYHVLNSVDAAKLRKVDTASAVSKAPSAKVPPSKPKSKSSKSKVPPVERKVSVQVKIPPFGAPVLKLAPRPYPTRRSDEYEVPLAVLESLARLLDVLGLSPQRLKRRVVIWDPFVGSGFSKRFWESRGYTVIQSSRHDFDHPDTLLSGKDYDWIITCGPFSESRFLMRRLRFEPKYIVLVMNDSIGRKMFRSYDAQLLFLQYGVKFQNLDGSAWSTPHNNTFTYVAKGLNLPTTNLWLNVDGTIANFEFLMPKAQKRLAKLAPPQRLLPVVSAVTESKSEQIEPEDPVPPEVVLNFEESRGRKFKGQKVHVKSAPQGMSAMDLLHLRYNHASETYLREMYIFPADMKLSYCDGCAFGKSKKHSFSSKSHKTFFMMDEAHTDLNGPIPVESYFRNRYFMLVMEISSRYTWVYFLREKGQAHAALKKWIAEAYNAKQMYPLVLLSDGGELDSKATQTLCDDYGIRYVTTARAASDQNPFVERKHLSVLESSLAMLFHSGVPRKFWEQAVDYSVYVGNRLGHKALYFASPISVWDEKGNRDHFRYCRIFGCKVWCYDTLSDKLSNRRAIMGVYMGQDRKKKANLVYGLESKRLFTSIHCNFDEGTFPFRKRQLWDDPLSFEKGNFDDYKALFQATNDVTFNGPIGPMDIGTRTPAPAPAPSPVARPVNSPVDAPVAPPDPPVEIVEDTPSVPTGPVSQPVVDAALDDSFDDLPPLQNPEEVKDSGIQVLSRDDAPSADMVSIDLVEDEKESEAESEAVSDSPPTPPLALRRPRRSQTLSRTAAENAQVRFNIEKSRAVLECRGEFSETLSNTREFTVNWEWSYVLDEVLRLHSNVDSSVQVPQSVKQSEKSKYSGLWWKSRVREYEGLVAKETWKVVPIPKNRRVISGRWVFDIKRNADNSVAYFKSRWVAHGFLQVEGVDFNETFSATARMKTFRLILAVSACAGLQVFHLDISQAFLYGKLDEEIYMVHPHGFPGPVGTCLKLLKSIYGLKQASRVWGLLLRAELVNLGFRQCYSDTCLFVHDEPKCYISTHVDDCLIATADVKFKDKILKSLQEKFIISDLGPVSQYLGILVKRTKLGAYKACQASYIDRMCERFDVRDDVKSLPQPLPTGLILSKSDCPTTDKEKDDMTKYPYRSLVGSLLYSALGTRPDIAFGVAQLSKFNANPGMKHWKMARRVLRYLKDTKNLGLTFSPGDLRVELFSDSDWGTNLDDRKSISGYVVRVSGGPVSWSSKTQKTVALSSCEAEFLALAEAAKEALWLRMILKEMAVEFDDPLVIKVDNQAAIALSKNAVNHSRSKHIDIRYFRIRDEIEAGRIKVIYVETGRNISDLLTKSPTLAQFARNIPDFLGI